MTTKTDSLFPAERFDDLALIFESSGITRTFGQLESRSSQVAHYLRSEHVGPGDTIAILLENRAEIFEIVWAAERLGIHYVVVNWHVTAPEIRYIIEDCAPQVIFTSGQLAELADSETPETTQGRVMLDRPSGGFPGWDDYDQLITGQKNTPVTDQCDGDVLLYSAGTTGRPKRIVHSTSDGPLGTYSEGRGMWLRDQLDFSPKDVYLSSAPLYHPSSLAWSMSANRSGGCVVVMESFGAAHALELIELHRVTHSQWFPAMFVRMLKLSSQTRQMYDLSSHRVAVHSGAPCAIDVKKRMIEWWGPILFEYYSNTEGVGAASITSKDWLEHPGSVGRPTLGTPTILGPDGNPLPAGEVGAIWFTGGAEFAYHGDPDRTAAAIDSQNRATVGDLGYLSDDGYLFVSDRREHLIVSGGVNICPQEIESALILHPEVLDVAVIGVPDNEVGERVVAFVELAETSVSEPVDDLDSYCRDRLAGLKVPWRYEFVSSVPRTPTGKLQRHKLRAEATSS
ncbi:AMP-binding protein [Rhodococcoides fascians]|uniref:AMP-binding protein n=1 Tax=Rhodococcoides fascians TaxID=1828 RepID=UPI00068E341A|nr:AMP-binding protein [Rhodococcus fascians]